MKTLIKDPGQKKDLELESWLLEISLNIAKLRKEKGYSQGTFAKKLGMNQSAIARIESGQNMKCSTIWKISDVLNVDLEIFGAGKEMEKQKVETLFKTSPVKRQITGATAKESAFHFNALSIPFTKPNLKANAVTQ